MGLCVFCVLRTEKMMRVREIMRKERKIFALILALSIQI